MRIHFFVDSELQVRRQVEVTVFDKDYEIVEVKHFDFTEDCLVIETYAGRISLSSVSSHKERFKVDLYMEEGSGEVITKSKVIEGTKWFEVDFEPNYEWKKEVAV